jgi:hypothetical protein
VIPAIPRRCPGLVPIVVTTSVSPSQRPTEYPKVVRIQFVARGQRPAVGEDAAHLHQGFLDDGDLARSEQDLQVVGKGHERRHAVRLAVVGGLRHFVAGVGLQLRLMRLPRLLRFANQHRLRASDLANGRKPQTAPVGKRVQRGLADLVGVGRADGSRVLGRRAGAPRQTHAEDRTHTQGRRHHDSTLSCLFPTCCSGRRTAARHRRRRRTGRSAAS